MSSPWRLSWGLIKETQAGEMPLTKAVAADQHSLSEDKENWSEVPNVSENQFQ